MKLYAPTQKVYRFKVKRGSDAGPVRRPLLRHPPALARYACSPGERPAQRPVRRKWPKEFDRTAIEELMGLQFMADSSSVVLFGNSGVGKTMVAPGDARPVPDTAMRIQGRLIPARRWHWPSTRRWAHRSSLLKSYKLHIGLWRHLLH